MPNIQTTDAQGLFTNKLIDHYEQMPKPTAFLRSFFPSVESPTLEVSIEVERENEPIAVDIVRGTDGNRNNFSRTTEKVFIPYYYNEYFDSTQLQLYDRLYGATEINDAVFAAYINSVARKTMSLQAKIERSYELQCAQALETGIVVTNAGSTNIDYKRKAASLVDLGGGNYWTSAVNPFEDFEDGCYFLRTVGKCEGEVFNAILGSTAISDLYKNTAFKERQNLFNMRLDAVAPPQRNAVGASYHGEITCGAYRVRLWSYPQYYQDPTTGAITPYVNPKKVTMLPENPHFKLAFGAVPQLITPGSMPKMGAFLIGDYIDQRKKSHDIVIESCGLAVPTAIDTIYTFKPCA